MNKLLYRKLSLDIIYFFLSVSLSITLIIWVIQAVNFLDIVSEDGHSLRVYFAYSILSLPKIFSRILPFCVFISIFYTLNRYENKNELLIFWTNGVSKKKFISNLAITGLYFLDNTVVKFAKQLKPSKRNELEIVDLLNKYKKQNKLSAEFLGRGGAWLDTGSIEDFYKTTNFVSAIENQQGFK